MKKKIGILLAVMILVTTLASIFTIIAIAEDLTEGETITISYMNTQDTTSDTTSLDTTAYSGGKQTVKPGEKFTLPTTSSNTYAGKDGFQLVWYTENGRTYKAGEEVVITISGKGLANVNAFGLALPYNSAEYDYVGIEAIGTGSMANYSKNRMHTNGETVVYPTFVNEGNQNTVNGDVELAKVTFKAKKNIKFNIKAVDGMIVDKFLNTVKF
jgi:ABC-type proline/glycine betaine transport system substrate-binding protein